MGQIIELTQLSPTMKEGTFVKWTKKVSDGISPGDILAEVETDKAVMEMEAYDEGILLVQLVKEGDRLAVGSPVAIIGDAGEDVSDLVEEAKARLKSIEGSGAAETAEVPPSAPEAPPAPAPVADRATPAVSVEAPKGAHGGRIFASPLARKFAQENNVDLSRVKGSGPSGRIVKEDIQTYIISQSDTIVAKARPDRRVELSGMRSIIAKRLTDAKANIPHFYLDLEFDAEPLSELRSRLNEDLASNGGEETIKISFNDLIVKAVALSLVKHPAVNSSWRGDHIVEYGRVDIGIAVAIDGGLITPCVRNADQLPLLPLAGRIRDLAKKARERKLKPEEYTDGTFTISNLGMFGITRFSAIINEPEAGILAVGGLVEKAVVKNGALVAGKTVSVTLSCDHRVIDGVTGARFLETFRHFVEHPHSLLIC